MEQITASIAEFNNPVLVFDDRELTELLAQEEQSGLVDADEAPTPEAR